MVRLLFTFAFLFTSSHAFALSLTFAGNIDGNAMHFNVFGDVYGPYNILSSGSTGTVWNHEWPISAAPDWALLDEIQPPSYVNNDNAYGQMYLTQRMDVNSGFLYHELLNGYDLGNLEIWSHEIIIRPAQKLPLPIEGMLNITDAFTYKERAYFASNFTQDGSTVPNWQISEITGFLTLVEIDLGNTQSGSNVVPTSADEPTSIVIFLLGIALMSFAVSRSTYNRP